MIEPTSSNTNQILKFKLTKGNDLVFAILGLLFGVGEIWTVLEWAWRPDFLLIAHNIRGGWLIILFHKIFGTTGLLIAFGFFGFWLICLGVGGVWRLIDGQATIIADAQGLHFHPSIGNKLIAWQDIRAVRVAGFSPVQVQFDLANRFWSTMACFTARTVRLNVRALGISVEEAKLKVDLLNKWLVCL